MLDIDGGNWPIFRTKIEDHLDSLGLDAHFSEANYPAKSYDDVEAKPIKAPTESDDDFGKRMTVWSEGEEKWLEKQRAWKKEDAKARIALGKVVPNSLYLEISENKRFCDMWKAVEARIEQITLHQKSSLKGRLNQMYCNEKDNVLTHLEEMEKIYQQLASRGARISDEDYVDAIIRSLPQSYSNLMTSMLTIYSEMGKPVTPAAIKNVVRKEYDGRQLASAARGK